MTDDSGVRGCHKCRFRRGLPIFLVATKAVRYLYGMIHKRLKSCLDPVGMVSWLSSLMFRHGHKGPESFHTTCAGTTHQSLELRTGGRGTWIKLQVGVLRPNSSRFLIFPKYVELFVRTLHGTHDARLMECAFKAVFF